MRIEEAIADIPDVDDSGGPDGRIDGSLVSRAPPFERRQIDGVQRVIRVGELERFIGDRASEGADWRWQSICDVQARIAQALFPCPFAKKSHERGAQWVTFLESTEPAQLEHLRLALREYVALIRTTNRRYDILNPLLALVRPSDGPMCLAAYHAQAWAALQYLHDRDDCPWPENVPTDPEHHLWTFSFSGMQLFVNFSAPAHLETKSRNLGRSLCLVINPRENFDVVAGDNPRGRRVRELVRERIAHYEGRPAATGLGTYGDPRNREWIQYAAAEAESPRPSRCPLRIHTTDDDVHARLLCEAARRAGKLRALRRQFHRHPELAFQEHETARTVADRLRAAGLEVREGLGGTGVLAVLRGARAGRTVAWRADMDALPIHEPPVEGESSTRPGIMHACGHDGHAAIAVLAAEILSEFRSDLRGTFVFLFQPAEEIFAGAAAMLKAGALAAPAVDEIYGCHLTAHLPSGDVAVGAGTMWASADILSIELQGQGGHAAYPNLTRSPIRCAAEVVVELHNTMARDVPATEIAVLSFGRIEAGSAANVIPANCTLSGVLRTVNPDIRGLVMDRLRRVVDEIGARHGVSAALVWSERACPPVTNDPSCAARVSAVARSALGPDRVHPSTVSMASDDIAVLMQACRGCYFRVGVGSLGEPVTPHHSSEFRMNEDGLDVGLRLAVSILSTASSDGASLTLPDRTRIDSGPTRDA